MLKRAFIITIVLLCAALIIMVPLAGMRRLDMSFSDLFTPSASLPADEHGVTNILILGVGDIGHAGQDLTDTMMVASIDASDPRGIIMLSIPRDLLLSSAESTGQGKINGLYSGWKSHWRRQKLSEEEASTKAMMSVATELSEKLGLNIHHTLKLNFTALVDAVDTLGGIDIVVPKRIADYSYPVQEGVIGTFIIDKGPQHIDGETALKYARSRHSTNDFDRSARQQQIIHALVDKLKEQKLVTQPKKLLALWDAFSENVEMTLSISELISLARTTGKIPAERRMSVQLNFQTGGFGAGAKPGGFVYSPPSALYGSASVLLPIGVDPKNEWGQIQKFANTLLRGREVYFANPVIDVQAMQSERNDAIQLRTELMRYGFTVRPVDRNDSATLNFPASAICLKPDTKRWIGAFFSELLKLPISCEGWTNEETDGTVTILLSKGYEFEAIALRKNQDPG